MSNTESVDYSTTTFDTVVVRKDDLLKVLETNRAKHDSVYNAAVSGYWVESQKTIEKKRDEFNAACTKMAAAFETYTGRLAIDFSQRYDELRSHIKGENHLGMGSFSIGHSFQSTPTFNGSWSLTYPENHLEDYDRVINMLQLSVADKVKLSAQDFDAYVRNNWSWRKSFLATNSQYVSSYSNLGTGFALNMGQFTSVTGGYVSSTIACSGMSVASAYRTLDSQF